MSNCGHDSIDEHDERDMPVPTLPGAGLVVVKAEFVLGSLKTFLDAPARAFDTSQDLD